MMGDVRTVWTGLSTVEKTREGGWRPERRTKLFCCPQDRRCDHCAELAYTGCPSACGGHDFHVCWQATIDSWRRPHWKLKQVAFYKIGPGKPSRTEIVCIYQVAILGRVKEIRMAEIPACVVCPGLTGPDGIAAWGLVFPQGMSRNGDRERNIARAQSGHGCVTLVNFPQVDTSFCEMDDGHSSFDDDETSAQRNLG